MPPLLPTLIALRGRGYSRNSPTRSRSALGDRNSLSGSSQQKEHNGQKERTTRGCVSYHFEDEALINAPEPELEELSRQPDENARP